VTFGIEAYSIAVDHICQSTLINRAEIVLFNLFTVLDETAKVTSCPVELVEGESEIVVK
jgi:hypothetical protein